MIKKGRLISGLISLLVTCSATNMLNAAQYSLEEYEHLATEAARNGYVRVMVTVGNFSLADIGNDLEGVRLATERAAQSVLSELGASALSGGYSHNGIGQLVVNVDANGLQALVNSSNATAFARDTTRNLRIKATSHDGSIDGLDSAFTTTNEVEVEIFLNVEAVDYDINRDGSTQFYPLSGMSDQIEDKVMEIMSQSYASGIVVLEQEAQRPVVRARIDRSAFYGLIESGNVRAVRPIGQADRPNGLKKLWKELRRQDNSLCQLLCGAETIFPPRSDICQRPKSKFRRMPIGGCLTTSLQQRIL